MEQKQIKIKSTLFRFAALRKADDIQRYGEMWSRDTGECDLSWVAGGSVNWYFGERSAVTGDTKLISRMGSPTKIFIVHHTQSQRAGGKPKGLLFML